MATKPEPLGDPEKVKAGEEVLICRGSKWVGRNVFLFKDGSSAPLHAKVKRFKDLALAELSCLNLTEAKDYKKLLAELRKTWPDFQENELITLIAINTRAKTPKVSGSPKVK